MLSEKSRREEAEEVGEGRKKEDTYWVGLFIQDSRK